MQTIGSWGAEALCPPLFFFKHPWWGHDLIKIKKLKIGKKTFLSTPIYSCLRCTWDINQWGTGFVITKIDLSQSDAEKLEFATSSVDYLMHVLKWLKCLRPIINAAARVLMRVSRRDIPSILDSLQWFPVKFEMEFEILLTYRALKGLAPSYLKETYSSISPQRALRSSSSQ